MVGQKSGEEEIKKPTFWKPRRITYPLNISKEKNTLDLDHLFRGTMTVNQSRHTTGRRITAILDNELKPRPRPPGLGEDLWKPAEKKAPAVMNTPSTSGTCAHF
jgi:hypothetical protein